MKVFLDKKPKNPVIIHGFPGFGLVGTIATEFLLDHLNIEKIGRIWVDELPAMVAIHKGVLVEPIGIFYNKKYNLIVINAVTALAGVEWKIADAIINIAKDVKAKEIISLEGIGSAEPSQLPKVYYHTSNVQKAKKLDSIGVELLKEGIVMGATGVLMLKSNEVPVSALFAETSSDMPDSKAAAKIIEKLDQYLGLKVDYNPLVKQAERFEDKLKDLLSKSKKSSKDLEKKKMSYVG